VEKLDREQELPTVMRLEHSERVKRNMVVLDCYKTITGVIRDIQLTKSSWDGGIEILLPFILLRRCTAK
jgi:hypothetical protein